MINLAKKAKNKDRLCQLQDKYYLKAYKLYKKAKIL